MEIGLTDKSEIDAAINRLIEQYRGMCLWFAPKEYFPASDSDRLRTLDYVERFGDREAFVRARELRGWLLQHSKKR